jgi:hypothetical protein
VRLVELVQKRTTPNAVLDQFGETVAGLSVSVRRTNEAISRLICCRTALSL